MKPEIKQQIHQLNNGEIPNGYKKTDFGVFPCDWVTDKTFGDLFEFYGGLSKSRDELGDEGHAYLHYGDLHKGDFNIASIEAYEKLPKLDISPKGNETYLMEDGDVAFLDASEDLEGTSRTVLIDNPDNEPFIAGLHIIYGKSKDNSLEKWFKQYITSSSSVKKQFQRLAVGFKVYGVNRDTLPRIKVAYPASLEEQSRIAEILMKWDKAIELYQKQIELLKKQKKAFLSELFPRKGEIVPRHRFPGFSAPWKQRKVAELFKITRGYVLAAPLTSESKSEEMPYPVYSSQTKDNGLMGYYKDYLYEDAITWTTDGANAGTVNYRAGKFYCTNVCGVLLQDKATPNQMIAEALNNVAKGHVSYVGNPKLMNNVMAEIEISLPSDEEERKQISSFFDQLDNLITLHQRKCEKIKYQRQVLQQYLLNGIVRV